MKETDIVQALRCCAEGECKDCAMHEDTQRCQENLLDKAAEAIERLTAENAALREKVPLTEDAMINLAAQVLGVEPSRLRELAEADKDGRCVVLPCKVGDTVWRIVRDGEPHITRDEVRDMYFADDMTLCVELVGGRVTFTEKFGKTVFLSREEAEKALREMEGKKDG
ncbi:MAG: hypothetical protein MR697_07780 [Clostridiales bacterium]|nr:hypothetical protein [Clostridiales bacterium]